MPYSPDADPTAIAKDRTEKGLIVEAAQLLGYKVEEPEEGHYKVTPPQRIQTQGDIDAAIRQRLNIGVDNLLNDYQESHGQIRRPVLRQVVTLAEQMAKSLRTSAR